MRHVPVVVVGGGPVGMVLALSLAGFNIRTLLVNTEPSARWFPKGSTHNARTMEHYRRLGLAHDIRKLGLPADHPTDVGFFTTLNGWELGRIAMPSECEKTAALANCSPTDQIPEPIFSLQPDVCRGRAAEAPSDARPGGIEIRLALRRDHRQPGTH